MEESNYGVVPYNKRVLKPAIFHLFYSCVTILIFFFFLFCVISFFRRVVKEILALLGCYAALIDSYLATFWSSSPK